MRRTYVDNSSNRSLGRVGMSLGSAPVSRSGGSSSYSSQGSRSSANPTKTYVDNSSNRNLGRVGMALGSAPVSRSGGSSSYSSQGSRSSASPTKTYAYNALNPSVGRVGKELDSTVAPKSTPTKSMPTNSTPTKSTPTKLTPTKSTPTKSDACTSAKTYVDSKQNRSLGRVGLEHGSAVASKSSDSNGANYYVDNAYNRSVGRVGLEKGTAVASKSSLSLKPIQENTKVYADNPYNKRLGRVGLPFGSAPHSSNSKKTYVDNYLKINLDINVGKDIEKIPNSSHCRDLSVERARLNQLFRNFHLQGNILSELSELIVDSKQKASLNPDSAVIYEQAEGILNRRVATYAPNPLSLETPPTKKGEIIKFSDIEFGDKIGSGGFGDVFVAFWKREYLVAVKKLRVEKVHKEKRLQFEKEVQILSSLSHPSIIHFYGACIQTPNLALVMEFMASGSLYDCLHIETIELTDRQKYQMISDSISGLEYIHVNSIAHRDIKSRNIMICDDLNHCKLADFGLALKDESDSTASVADFSVVGTYRYSAPEILEGQRLTIEQLFCADIYSMGVTLMELLTEKEPFSDYNVFQLRKAVLEGEKPKWNDICIPSYLQVLINKCISKSPADRPTASNFLMCFKRFNTAIGEKETDLSINND